MGLAQTAYAQIPGQRLTRISLTEGVSGHYLAVAESAALAPKERAAWQQRLDVAHDTLTSVLAWYDDHERGSESLRLLVALSRFWSGPSLVSGFERALLIPGTQPAIRARALNSAAAAAFRVKDQDRTRRWASESIDVWRSLGDSAQMGRAYERLVQMALRDDNHAALRALADTGDLLCVHAHDDDCQAYFLNMRGESARVLKQYDSAAVYYDKAAAIYSRVSPVFRLDIAHNIGFALLDAGRVTDARHRFREGLQRAVASANRTYYPFMFAGFASCDAADRNALSAAKLFGVSDAQLDQLGIVADPADAVEYERYRSIARTQLGVAAFDAAVRIGRRLSVDSLIAALK